MICIRKGPLSLVFEGVKVRGAAVELEATAEDEREGGERGAREDEVPQVTEVDDMLFLLVERELVYDLSAAERFRNPNRMQKWVKRGGRQAGELSPPFLSPCCP